MGNLGQSGSVESMEKKNQGQAEVVTGIPKPDQATVTGARGPATADIGQKLLILAHSLWTEPLAHNLS